MRLPSILFLLAGTGAIGTAGLTFPIWRDWVLPPPVTSPAAEHHEHHDPDKVHLSPQARRNLRLVVQPMRLTTFTKAIQVPGMVVDRPGRCDFSVPAPMAGIIQSVTAVPGRTVTAGEELLTLRLLSEGLQQSQTELFKTTRELKIVQEQKDRLATAARSGAVPEARMIELDNQERRLSANLQALRHDLKARGLNAEQIQEITEGRFLTETRVVVPARPATEKLLASPAESHHAPVFEVQSLNVRLGDFVQAGQTLCVLNDHQHLFIEGHAFPQEAPLLEQTVRNHWPVEADFAESADSRWPRTTDELRIEYLNSTMDSESRTLSFFLELPNQSRAYTDGGKTVRVWRFRPGQRVRLRVPIEELKNVLVLPPSAVVREGPEVFVFRQNGDLFQRCTVHVVYEDSRTVVVANDGSIGAGQFIAHNGAAAMNRILKVQEGGEGHDHHHDH